MSFRLGKATRSQTIMFVVWVQMDCDVVKAYTPMTCLADSHYRDEVLDATLHRSKQLLWKETISVLH